MHVLSGHTAPVTCGRFTPDGAPPVFTLVGRHSERLFAPTGKKILTASEDSTLILWDPRTGQPVHKLSPSDARFRLDGGINCLAINPASTVAVLGGAEGGLRAVNLVQGSVLAQMEGHEEGASIEMVAFNEIPTVGGASGASVTVIVSVGTDGRVCTWEASGFRLRNTGTHEVSRPSETSSLALAPTARLRHARVELKQLRLTLAPLPQDAVTSLSFSPHTPTFLTGSADKTLKLWDYRTGSCLRTLLGNRDVVHAVSVSRDGRVAVSGSEDGSVRTFRLD